jgi:hypothetical protein
MNDVIMVPETRAGMAIALLLGMGACARSEVPAASPPRQAPEPFVKSVRRLGVVGKVAARAAHAIAYDGGWSIQLDSGELMWVFGDTFFGERGSPDARLEALFGHWGPLDLRVESSRSHSALLAPRLDWRGATQPSRWLGGAAGTETAALIDSPVTEDLPSVRVWPMHGLEVVGAGGSRQVQIFYVVVRVRAGVEPPFNFVVLGVGLAQGEPGRGPLEVLKSSDDWRFFAADQPQFGAAVLAADVHDYVFGTRADDGANHVYVARVGHGRLADRSSYRFLTRDGGWSEDVLAAAPIFGEAPGDLSVSWNEHLRAYLAVHARALSSGREVLARTAPRPEGPYREASVLFHVDDNPAGASFLYAAKEHPALAENGGRVIHVSVVDSREAVPALWRIELGSR